MLLCWCLAEAKAAADDAAAGDRLRSNDQRRWELFGALSLAGMLASKYFAWHVALGLSTTPKSEDPVRQAENLAAASLVLEVADVEALSALDGTEPDVTSPYTFGH